MIGRSGAALLRRISPQRGLHVRRWGPSHARLVDQLTREGLVLWGTSSAYPGRSRETRGFEAQHIARHMGMRITLTPKGRVTRSKS